MKKIIGFYFESFYAGYIANGKEIFFHMQNTTFKAVIGKQRY